VPGAPLTPISEASPDWAHGVLASLYQAAFSAPDREVAGVLVGRAGAGTEQPHIQAIIPATEGHQIGQAAMFGHDSWAYVHDAMARHYPGLDLVGWYVSRPGNGCALTPADLLNHQRWFSHAHQVLLVLDSRTHRGALFGWRGAQLSCLHEGPVARRYTRAPREGPPVAGLVMLSGLGVLLGLLAYILSEAL